MSDFKAKLQKNAEENTPEKRYERRRMELLENLYESIKRDCLWQSEIGGVWESFLLREKIKKTFGEESEELKYFLRHPGDGYADDWGHVLKDPETIKNFLTTKLNEDGLTDIKFEERKCPVYETYLHTTENSTGLKALSVGLNLFLGADLDVETTTTKKRRKIGEQIADYKLIVQW